MQTSVACSQGMCCLSPSQMIGIREAVFPIARPWDPPCMWRDERELERVFAGMRNRMAFEGTDFGPKYERSAAIEDLMALLQMPESAPPSKGISLREAIGEKVSFFWNCFCKLRPVDFAHPLLQTIDRVIGAASFVFPVEKLKQFFTPLGMVRSSGPEDGMIPNAGGHRSMPARLEQLPDAVRSVVASYYERPSLESFLRANRDLCQRDLHFGALLQPFISPQTSFVHTTGHPSRTSSTWGFGKGVVERGLGTDTFHCLPSRAREGLFCHIHVELKSHRWEVLVNGSLSLEMNHHPTQPTLTLAELEHIHRIGQVFKVFFGDPEEDIEGVNGRIFVQARPYHPSNPVESAEYLDCEVPSARYVEVLISAKNKLIVISDESQFLRAPTLQNALRLWKDSHLLIIVDHSEPRNSHWILEATPLGIPVVFDPEFKEVVPFALDTQTERILDWDSSLEGFRRVGLVMHPARISPSLPNAYPFLKILPTAPQEIRAFVRQLPIAPKTALSKLKSLFLPHREVLEPSPFAKVLHQYDAYVARLFEEIEASLKHSMDLLFFAKVLEQTARIDIEEIARFAPEACAYQKALSHPAHFLDLLFLGTRVPSHEAFAHWRELLLQWEGQPALHGSLRQFISLLQRHESALSMWILFFQPQAPELLPGADESLFDSELETTASVEWFDALERAPAVMHLTILERMREMIELYNDELKLAYGDSSSDKVRKFKKMLTPFLGLFKIWQQKMDTGLMKQSLSDLEKVLKEAPMDLNQLKISDGFDVSRALIGRLLPTTLADLWTFIHQHLHRLLSMYSQRQLPLEVIQRSFLPLAFIEVIAFIEGREWNLKIFRTGIRITLEGAYFSYHVPLREHSSSFEIRCNAEGECIFSGQVFEWGEARLAVVSSAFEIFQRFAGFSISKFEGEKFSWKLSPSQLKRVFPEYIAINQYTMDLDAAKLMIGLLDRLALKREQKYPILLQMARRFSHQRDESSRKGAIALWKLLIKEGYRKEAIEWVTEASQSRDWGEKKVTLMFLEDFEEMGFSCSFVFRRIAAYLESPSILTRIDTVDFWKRKLLNTEQGRKEAVQRAVSAIQHEDVGVQITGFLFFKELVARGQGLEIAEELAASHLLHPHPYIQRDALQVLRILVENKRKMDPEVLQKALALVNYPDSIVRQAATQLRESIS